LLLDEQVADAFQREQLLAEAQAARAEAERADRSKSDLLAAVSHELRTPLAAIGGYAELLELGLRGPLTEDQRQDIVRIRIAQQHMQHLVDDLLLYFRLGFNGLQVDVGRVRIGDLVAGLSSFVAPQANQRRVTIDIGPAVKDVDVLADIDRARQILLNLLTNAVKFSKGDSTVSLSLEVAEDHVRVLVQDAGPGIAPQDADAVFQPFVQSGSATARGGFGLGLAISRKLAELMGGSLRLRASSEHGSTFELTLRRT
jgi:signal transduction histidine kinase